MAEISFESVAAGVKSALEAAFPAPCMVHEGFVPQGLAAGDFNVLLPGAGQRQTLGRRYRRTPTVDVIWYPRTGAQSECLAMAGTLCGVLESIATPGGDILHAASIDWRVEADGGLPGGAVLHVLAAYEHFVYAPQEEIYMERLTLDQRG